MDELKRLKFKSGIPTIVEASCRRSFSADEAPEGRVRTGVDASLDFSDDHQTLQVRLTVTTKGIAEAGKDTAFEATCTVECSYVFNHPREEADLEQRPFIRTFCDPLYQRSAALLQDLIWRMGYNAVRLPLMFPEGNREQKAPEQAEPKRTRRPRKKAAEAAVK
ncbi:hypothetical protein [Thauera chlorobenzoica]|uniref:hypothetical protein n=1 Tax=Thauera chlorobenzoica TaxID=96773 RepID=UPI0008A05E41|nr:hypothetical protein [Thauera chlorobenzoica]SEG30196.1 hypothetical protein SAMN05216242_13912 [Thauera chlorobenzoica]